MDLFLAFYMIVVFALGYFLMVKLDRVLNGRPFNNASDEPFNDKKSYILVFGYSTIAKKLMHLLVLNHLDFIVIEKEDQMNKSLSYSHLYAISESDYSNLIISLIAKKTLGIEYVLAICNNIENKSIFEENKIKMLQVDENIVEKLYMVFFASKSKVIGND